MFQAPPAWFRDEVHTLISRGDITPEEGLLTMIDPPDWAFAPKPLGAGTVPDLIPFADSKVCDDCWIELPMESFYVKPDGQVHNICRPCANARKRKQKQARIGPIREYDRKRKRKVQVAA